MDINLFSQEIIGSNTFFNTPYGKRLITYADYTASGKTLRFIETYLVKIQEVYANTHTIDSFTGKTTTQLVNKALNIIKKQINANKNNYIIPIGTGATSAIKKLSEILGIYVSPKIKSLINNYLFIENNLRKPIVYVSPYEHHSNYLIWKESLADVEVIKLTKDCELDYQDLETKLKKYPHNLKIGSFTAASNVTGIKTDVYKLARLMHQYKGLAFFDFAACAPYVEININKDDFSYFDGIFISPHKFIGGPGSSGILVIHKNIYNKTLPPTVCGGGTVHFVSPYNYEFSYDIETRENAGTPGILQILKAALTFEFKDYIGIEKIIACEEKMLKQAFDELNDDNNIIIYGPKDVSKRISILSFNIKHNDKLLHHRFVSRLLNDLFGIQSRAGCVCAGLYAHEILGIDEEKSKLLQKYTKTRESLRPGFVRINFHYLMTEEEVNFIIKAIKFIARYGFIFLTQYRINLTTGEWKHNYLHEYNPYVDNFGLLESLKLINEKVKTPIIDKNKEYETYLIEAKRIADILKRKFQPNYQKYDKDIYEKLRWFNFIIYDI